MSHAALPALRVAMFGSLPPDRGISAYCMECASAVGQRSVVEFIGFARLYPSWLYPGGDLQPDATFPQPDPSRIRARRRLRWYNPLTWLWEGLTCPGDLLHVQFWSAFQLPIQLTVMSMFRLRFKPVVLTLHNLSSHRAGGRWFDLGVRCLLRLADGAIVHSEELRRTAMARFGLPAERVFSVPPGRMGVFRQREWSQLESRRKLGLGERDRVVLLFGAIRGYKGLDTLIEAMATVAREAPQAVLLVAGKLWEPWAPYANLIERHGLQDRVKCRLEYIPTDQVQDLLAACDVAALPYRHFEAQSGVALAALDFARPLVVTSVGGLPELAPQGSLVVPPDDPAALAQALTAVLTNDDLRERLAAGAAQAAAEHSWEAAAAATWKVYEQLTGVQGHAK